MRLEVLNSDYNIGTRFLFAIIRLASRYSVPDAAKLVFYRSEFYGDLAKDLTHQAMRGPSAWSIADRELMAAYVSRVNDNAFCIGAHTATAAMAYRDQAKVAAALGNIDTAPIAEPLRATLRMLGKLTRGHAVTAEDVRELRTANVSPDQIRDALAVCFAFNVTDRLADAFGFEVPSTAGFEAGAKYLLRRGYR
jgi:uncharacterized peroxidase-related enzyme